MQEEQVGRKDDFREDDAVFIVLPPENPKIKGLIERDKCGNAPIIPGRQRIVVAQNAAYGLKPVVGQPRR